MIDPSNLSPENLAQANLIPYCQYMNKAYMDPLHLRLIARHLEAVEKGKIKRLMIFTAPRHGKPVDVNNLILMENGTYKKLDDIKIGNKVITYKGRSRKVKNIFEQGELPCLEIETDGGRKIRTAYDHPFLTTNGWKEAKDLKEGNYLALVANYKIEPTAKESIEEFIFAGYMIGDGSCRGTQNFTNGEWRIIEDFEKVCDKLGFSINRRRTGKNCITVYPRKCRDWLRKYNLYGKLSKEKEIPDFIFKGSNEQIGAFLGAYFLCDGSINKKGKKRTDCAIELFSVNKKLVIQVQKLLLRLGVYSRVRKKKGLYHGRQHISYRLSITSFDYVAILFKKIRLIGRKKQLLKNWNPTRNSFYNNNLLPDRILSIKNVEPCKCKCLEVEEDFTFTCDNIVVHNTHLVSEYFAAWFMGRNPDKFIISTTYSFDRANDTGRKVRNQLIDPQFQQVFPNCHISKDSKGANKFTTLEHGEYFSVGVGGAVTGRGAHCICKGAMITTDKGSIEISKLIKKFFKKNNIKVLSYKEGTNEKVFRRVLAASVSWKQNLCEVFTFYGKTLKTTKDHLYYVINKGYVKAENLKIGDPLLYDTVVGYREISSKPVPVYDIQVEETNNFFANEILVHNCFLIDDPLKGREDAESEISQRKLRDWFKGVAYTRLMKNGAIIIIMTRWHYYDLAGWLLEERKNENWHVLKLPAIAEESDLIGREPGDALWPEMYPIETLKTIRETVGTREWTSQYQQSPLPDEGGMVKLDWFRRYKWHDLSRLKGYCRKYGKINDDESPLQFQKIYISWDTAFKAAELNDPSACTVWGVMKNKDAYLVEVINKRLEFPDLKKKAVSIYEKYRENFNLNHSQIVVLIEDKASGQSLIQVLRRETPMNIIPINPDANKEIRMSEATAPIEAGKVFLPEEAPWLVEYETQMCQFPLSKKKDMVDSTSQFIRQIGKPSYRKRRRNKFWK